MSKKINQKVVIIGLDGADFKYINSLIKTNKLPNLKKLISRGASGRLKSTIPNYTAVAWPSIFTGKNPGEHGSMDVINWIKFKNTFKNIPTHLLGFRGTTFWEYANSENKKAIVVNAPMTYPPREINGCLVTGFDTPPRAKDNVYPKKIKKELGSDLKKFYQYQSKLMLKRFATGVPRSVFVNNLIKTRKYQTRVIKKLIHSAPWDLLMTVLQITDIANHFTNYKNDQKPLEQAYIEADKFIGDIREMVPKNSTLIIISDHGSKVTHKKISLAQFFKNLDLITFKNKPTKNLGKTVKNELRKLIIEVWPLKRGRTFLHQRLERVWKNPKKRKQLTNFYLKLKPGLKDNFSNLDWQKTKVYFPTSIGNIYITKKAKKTRDQIISEMNQLFDNEGEKVFEKVFKKEDLWSGKYLKKDTVPDIIFQLSEDYKAVFSLPSGKLFEKSSKFEPGEHASHGIIIIDSPKIKVKQIKNAKIFDVAPTALSALSCQIPSDIEGNVLAGFKSQTKKIDLKSKKSKSNINQKDIDKIKSRLEALGYLE